MFTFQTGDSEGVAFPGKDLCVALEKTLRYFWVILRRLWDTVRDNEANSSYMKIGGELIRVPEREDQGCRASAFVAVLL